MDSGFLGCNFALRFSRVQSVFLCCVFFFCGDGMASAERGGGGEVDNDEQSGGRQI